MKHEFAGLDATAQAELVHNKEASPLAIVAAETALTLEQIGRLVGHKLKTSSRLPGTWQGEACGWRPAITWPEFNRYSL